ncbi:citrate synthase [Kineococcus xinjiangensis]|uniref:Citrate synthase n=1 Tax=Kineococcus xinjiangensis TaxID=512762 RepID=A0A2S6IFD2_9ACTN|nr:bifunctional 2-methylcitrate synthase/citrate synthase [Kineococcus xinjiangensis]PPK92919.1 citrate synthase [Kineococcus xinjiangensis]
MTAATDGTAAGAGSGAEEPQIRKGLAGVVVDTTAVSKVVPETNSLTYRGYPVQELAQSCSMEEVAHLLWHGELPTAAELAAQQQEERSQRALDPVLRGVLDALPTTCHPMDVLRTAVSVLGARDPRAARDDRETNLAKSLTLFAQLPAVVAHDMRRRRGLEPVEPDAELGYSENFLRMCFGEVPDEVSVRAFEVSLVLYAEHSFNASTFAARVVTSTLSDLHSAVTAAIGALKGPLHGGANEAVMHAMLEIGDPERAADWLRGEIAAKRKIMGFGHRVYRNGDSRVPTMEAAFRELAAARGGEKWVRMYEELQRTMAEEKGIHPNLDFPTGPAYHLLGFDIEVFTPLFVMSRVTGWTAHIVEQLEANALIRPLSHYVGQPQRSVPVR